MFDPTIGIKAKVTSFISNEIIVETEIVTSFIDCSMAEARWVKSQSKSSIPKRAIA